MSDPIRTALKVFLAVGFVFAGSWAFASNLCPSDAALSGTADLVVLGSVRRTSSDKEGAGMVASFQVDNQLKGRCAPVISVRYSYYPGVDPDSQDPNFDHYLKKDLILFLNCVDRSRRRYELRWGSCCCLSGDEAKKRFPGIVASISAQQLEPARALQEQAVEAAMGQFMALGFNGGGPIVDIDDQNSLWNSWLSSEKGFWPGHSGLEKSLSGKDYWAIYFSPAGVAAYGAWIFVERNSFAVLTYYKPEKK
jgi:hypothetical protein